MNIVFHDEHLVVVNKPAGLLVHRSPVANKESDFAMQMVRDSIGQHVYPVHRLDRPTSGVILFALTPEVASAMSELFRAGAIEKRYIAVVRGYTDDAGIIDNPLRRIVDKYGKAIRKTDEKQEATTHYKRLTTVELSVAVDKYPTSRYSLVELIPKTGRRHQLRRHMKHIFHPIIGDPKYGKSVHNNYFKKNLNCQRLLLAATAIAFKHPNTNESIFISALPDDSFLSIIKLFEFDVPGYLKEIKK